MSYSDQLNKKIEKVYEHYEASDTLEFLQQIMMFVDECVDLIPDELFVLPKTQINTFREAARKVWTNDGSVQELSRIGFEYQQEVLKIKPFNELVRVDKEYAAFGAVSCYLSNYHDDPTNQFVYDFIELFVANLDTIGIQETLLEPAINKHFRDVI